MEYTYEEVLEAYIKLKTYIYYDSTNLFMRKELAVFETDLDEDNPFSNSFAYEHYKELYKIDTEKDAELVLYEKNLKVFTTALNKYHENPEYFNDLLGRIKTKFLPKKIKDSNANSRIITNKRTSNEYEVTRSSVFIDAPIEIHLIAVLWILKQGFKLDKELFDGCLGNRLILNQDKDSVVQGSGLFKPYPKQYQKWRDDSIKVAKEHLEKGENVLILNLDIRDFFYSVRVPKEEIEKTPYHNRKALKSLNNLYTIFGEIHTIFTKKVSTEFKIPYDFSKEIYNNQRQEFCVLPIGLLSSFILANHYLVAFDKSIEKKAKPVYYGRYVDDILMVFTNPIQPNEKVSDTIKELNFNFENYKKWLIESISLDKSEFLSEGNYDKLSDLEQTVLANLYPIITLINKPSFLSNGIKSELDERVFKLNGYERLYCQSDKTILYYFEKNESSLVIDKLKRDIEEKSSEFRNYTDADGEDDFEESAYHLLYDGSEGKVRTLKDYKEDKFGLSVYLSKKIFNALRRADKISDAEAEKIVKFFRGANTLNLYTLWERVFVFLLVNNKADAYVKFYLNCNQAIMGIKSSHHDDYQNDVFTYLEYANELALSLHPNFLSEIEKVKRTYEFSFNALKNDHPFFQARYSPTSEESYYIRRFRDSNLVRHHYAAQPLLTYIESNYSGYQNLTNLKIPF